MKLEARIQSWGYSVGSGTYTNVYVTKGGTLNELAANLVGADNISTTAEGYTIKGLACPKYYYMAVLAERDGTYQSIAFWCLMMALYLRIRQQKICSNIW